MININVCFDGADEAKLRIFKKECRRTWKEIVLIAAGILKEEENET